MHISSPRSSRSHLEAFSSWRSALCPSPTSLRAYFASGWAFFIPYLAAYLLYAWLKWPANPPAEHRSLATVLWPPALLHVYWALHVINAVLAVVALRSWWRDAKREEQRAESDLPPATGSSPAPLHPLLSALGSSTASSPSALGPSPALPSSSPAPLRPSPSALGSSPAPLRPSPLALRRTAIAVLPWLFPTLIFAIPGVYLEWPSDPWEHLRRITEWKIHPLVGDHSAGYKSFYFFAYSWVGWLAPAHLLSWLNVYYVGACLLLAWQYYLLAKAVGLDRRWAFLFVLLNAITFGNSVFSFYRYYGLSSSIFAQLGAVALTRIVLEWAKGKEGRAKSEGRGAWSEEERAKGRIVTTTSQAQRVYGDKLLRPWRLPLTALPAALRSAAPLWIGRFALCALLLAFIAFNHVQGIGIAGLGVLAVVVWRLIDWKRAMLGWLVLVAVLLSIATVLWFPHNPALDAVYRPQGWLTAWYGFNLFTPSSPAFDRAMQILGAFGVINLVPGLWLASRQNHIVGWLTVMPVLALALPCFALPLAHVLASQTRPENIITFQRFLFAVPMGLALVAVIPHWAQSAARNGTRAINSQKPSVRSYSLLATRYSLLIPFSLLLALLTVLPAGKSSYNHFWHSMQITPDDLQLKPYFAAWTPDNLALAQKDSTLVVTTPLSAKVREIFSPSLNRPWQRQTHAPLSTAELEQQLDWLHAVLLSDSDWIQAAAEPISLEPSPDWLQLSRRDSSSGEAHIVADFTASDSLWLRLGGHTQKQEFIMGRLTISNPAGASTSVFSPDLIPIDRSKRYRLTSTIRQKGDHSATNYLAIAWYDQDRRLLESSRQQPEGAGSPPGWSNGTYSYYGLANRPAPSLWTHYTITFGVGETAAIPVNAAFLRAGALLNYHSTPKAVVQLKDVSLEEGPCFQYLILIASASSALHTSISQAAWLSGHWSPQQVMIGYSGNKELTKSIMRYSSIAGSLPLTRSPPPLPVMVKTIYLK